MRKTINNLLDKFLINKNLKFAFGIVLFLIITFFVTAIVMIYNNEICFNEILGPMTIALSALLASSVAMINLRTNEISRVLKETKENRTALLHTLSKLSFIIKKLPLYKSAIEKSDKFDYILLTQYISVFSKYEVVLNDKLLIYHLDNKHDNLINGIDTYLFYINAHNQNIKLFYENNNYKPLEKLDTGKIKAQVEKIESLIVNSKHLYNEITYIIKELAKEQNKLATEENY